MSTASLLILSARLRSIAEADGYRHPASSTALSGRSRVTGSVAAVLAALSSTFAVAASAQQKDDKPDIVVQARIGTSPSDQPCVTVDVAGERAGGVHCVAERLDRAAKDAQARAANVPELAVPTARSRDVVTGVANQTATRQRMGNAYGQSVYPQRPAAPVPPPKATRP